MYLPHQHAPFPQCRIACQLFSEPGLTLDLIWFICKLEGIIWGAFWRLAMAEVCTRAPSDWLLVIMKTLGMSQYFQFSNSNYTGAVYYGRGRAGGGNCNIQL